MKLIPISLPEKASAAETRAYAKAQKICASFAAGRAFRHLSAGAGKEVHCRIISEIASGLFAGGKTIDEVATILGSLEIQAGNTSAWSKWLDNVLQWQAEDGKKLPFLKKAPEAPASTDESDPLY